MHIAVDSDDVVVDFIGMIVDTVSRDFGVEPPIVSTDITDWQFGQFLDQHIGEPWWEWLEKHAYLWGEKAKPISGAIGGIAKLRAAGHRVELLTSKPPWAERYMWTWLARYAPNVNQVTLVPLNGYKPDWTDAYLLIDDRDKNVIEWVHSTPDREAFLYPAAHNSQFWPHKNLTASEARRITIVKDWDHVIELLTPVNWEAANV